MGLENTKREVEAWPSRFSGEGEDREENLDLRRFECPCGCGSYSRGGRYLRGHEEIHAKKMRRRKDGKKIRKG